MSLKAELETWAAALKAYDEEDFEKSLDLFSRIADSSKILTNMGLIYATLGEHETAVEQFNAATSLDQYLAVAYFQCGVSNFLLGRYDLALKDFEEAFLYLRGNQAINYEQLGLKFKLFSAEVLFNRGLSLIYMNRMDEGMRDLQEARREKATEEHNVIDDALQDRGDGYTVFSIPVGVLYRPPENKLRNARTKDYLGKAKLVAATDALDAYTTFTGSTRLAMGVTPGGAAVDRPASEPTISRSQSANAAIPASRLSPRDEGDAPPNLSRSKTAASFADRSERSAPAATTNGSGNNLLTRAPTLNRAGVGVGIGQPVRGLSLRRANGAPSPRSPSQERGNSRDRDRDRDAPQPPSKGRNTEFFDDYIDSYTSEIPPPPPPQSRQQPADRVAAWARNNAKPPSRTPSQRSPSAYAPSAYGSNASRRQPPMRRGTTRGSSRTMSAYEEEEEGYVSGEYDDGPYELVKIRVKLHYEGDIRGMALTPDVPFDEFSDRVRVKFGRPLNLRFTDEDGVKVSLRDDGDYDLAIETAKESANGKSEGKLEVWCTDV